MAWFSFNDWPQIENKRLQKFFAKFAPAKTSNSDHWSKNKIHRKKKLLLHFFPLHVSFIFSVRFLLASSWCCCMVLLHGAVIELCVPWREGCVSSHYHTKRTNVHRDGKTRQAEHRISKDRKSLIINYQQFENTNELDARGTRHWRRERKWMKEQQKKRTKKNTPGENNRSYLSHRSKTTM